ncbi:MAG: sigma-70 family RNA polymerase sigma factor [Chitinophagaceae bacterium]|nr:sigma-70 family RNA polymerase sigma factor [Chitinophagaceae bacterium]
MQIQKNELPVSNQILSTPTVSDEFLLEKFKQTGAQEPLAKLYLRYTGLVYGVCLKYLKDGETAKDAVMNIYQELLQKVPKHEINNFKSWLYVLVKNHCLMYLRSAKKMVIVNTGTEFMQSDENLHLDALQEKEMQLTLLENCIEQLPNVQKQSIRLFYLQSKCYNEIVEETGIEWGKVRSLIQNGRRNLKICIEKNNSEQ